jgi:flagellar basal-body rod protein FlgC
MNIAHNRPAHMSAQRTRSFGQILGNCGIIRCGTRLTTEPVSIASTIAVSGLNVASLRLQVAASGPLPGTPNPENFPSAYSPLRVNQIDSFGGGTSAIVTGVSPAAVAAFDPSAPYADDHGMVASPNIDLVNELVQMLLARFHYTANAQVIRADAHMNAALLDITA